MKYRCKTCGTEFETDPGCTSCCACGSDDLEEKSEEEERPKSEEASRPPKSDKTPPGCFAKLLGLAIVIGVGYWVLPLLWKITWGTLCFIGRHWIISLIILAIVCFIRSQKKKS